MRPRGGFTLTEVLVVIAVLTVLGALAFPVLSTVRDRARLTACAANLAQLGRALQMYSQDWDGFVPPYRTEALSVYAPLQSWLFVRSMAPYTRGPAVWRCPGDPLAGQSRVGVHTYHRWSSYVFTGPSRDIPLQHVDAPDPTGRRGPAEVAYATDDSVYMVIAMTRFGPMVPRAPIVGNHPGGANRLFFDGHIRYREYPDLSGSRRRNDGRR